MTEHSQALTAMSVALAVMISHSAAAGDVLPKFGPNATPITEDRSYLKVAEAPDYWAMAPYYQAQQTSSACSLASITTAINMLRGLPDDAETTLMTQDSLLIAVADETWRAQNEEEGEGVTFANLVTQTAASFAAMELPVILESAQPAKGGEATLEALRTLLAANEATADDTLLVYFNQGVVTGDWDGPHVSPVGAYDAAKDRVLIMDVDREWYVPYWTSTETLFNAMMRPAPEDQGVLAGETGGWVYVSRKRRS